MNVVCGQKQGPSARQTLRFCKERPSDLVTKYRRCILDREAIEKLRQIFPKVCTDFEATLVQIDGGSNHLHLLGELPAESIGLITGELLKERLELRSRTPVAAHCQVQLGRMSGGRLLTLPHPAAAHRLTESNATLSSKPHHSTRGLPRPEFRGLRHSLVKARRGGRKRWG